MRAALEQLIWRRARARCEYCQLPQALSRIPFEIDHIIALKHGGLSIASNLALACYYCNTYKGPNLSGIDPKTGRIVRLFNPRHHKWIAHFRWKGPVLVGRTPSGRATISVLAINHPAAIAARAALIQEGVFPGD
jgi:hypothetical protein